jgi:hypothetical protein
VYLFEHYKDVREALDVSVTRLTLVDVGVVGLLTGLLALLLVAVSGTSGSLALARSLGCVRLDGSLGGSRSGGLSGGGSGLISNHQSTTVRSHEVQLTLGAIGERRKRAGGGWGRRLGYEQATVLSRRVFLYGVTVADFKFALYIITCNQQERASHVIMTGSIRKMTF